MEGLDPKSLYSFELCSCGAKIFLSRFYSLDPKSLYSIEYYEWPSREAAGARVYIMYMYIFKKWMKKYVFYF